MTLPPENGLSSLRNFLATCAVCFWSTLPQGDNHFFTPEVPAALHRPPSIRPASSAKQGSFRPASSRNSAVVRLYPSCRQDASNDSAAVHRNRSSVINLPSTRSTTSCDMPTSWFARNCPKQTVLSALACVDTTARLFTAMSPRSPLPPFPPLTRLAHQSDSPRSG